MVLELTTLHTKKKQKKRKETSHYDILLEKSDFVPVCYGLSMKASLVNVVLYMSGASQIDLYLLHTNIRPFPGVIRYFDHVPFKYIYF